MADATGGTVVSFWFDPNCPYAWNTSLWVRTVARTRPVQVRWRPFSLQRHTAGQNLPDRLAADLAASHRLLRVLVAAATEEGGGDDLAAAAILGELYLAAGRRIHHGHRPPSDEIAAEALAAAGLPAGLLAAWDDERWDEPVDASTAAARALAGDDAGVPVLGLGAEPTTAFFGPVLSPPPDAERAPAMWDAWVTLAGEPGFFELKRARRSGVVLGPEPPG